MTTNSLEAVAGSSNDGLLCLDELGQADAREIGDIVYGLANGSPKQRMTGSVGPGWNLLILSSGETSFADHMLTAGKHARAGQQVRLCDLEANAGAGLGMFECLHDFKDPAAFARHLAVSAGRYYGSPIREFLKFLVKEREKVEKIALTLRDEFLSQHVPAGASGQVRRAASRFALVAAAGELATSAGISGWVEDESMNAARICFESWLRGRGNHTVGPAEKMIAQIRAFIEMHEKAQNSFARCSAPDGNSAGASNVAGLRVGREAGSPLYFVGPEVFRRDMCAGFDHKLVLRTLKVHGYLEHDRGRLDKSVRLPGAGKKRVYAIKLSILASSPAQTAHGRI